MDKVARSLIDFIDLIDCLRPSWKIYPCYASRISISFLPPYLILEQYDSEFPKDIVSSMKEYRMLSLERPLSMKRFILYLILMFFSISIDSEIIFPIFSVNPFSSLAYILAVGSAIGVLIVATCLFHVNDKNRSGRIYNSDLLRMAQRTIDYSREYFKKNGINPKQYPIKLAFNDYQGLTYEKKGRRYIAYLDV